MSNSRDVKVEITGDASGLLTALKAGASGTEAMAHSMESAVGGVASMLEKFAAPLTAFLGVLGGGALFKEAVTETAEYGDTLAKTAQKVGVSVESLSGLSHAAKLAGVDFESLTGGLGKLAKNMQLAVFTPNSPAAAAFKALGIQVEDASGHLRSTDDVLGDVAERFSHMEDSAGKTALAMNLFGRSGKDMIPLLNEGREGIAELKAEAQRLGVVMTTEQAKAAEKYKDDMERVEAAMQGLKIRIGSEVMPALDRLATWFTEKAPAMLSGITSAMRTVGDLFSNTAFQIIALSTAITFAIQGAIIPMVMSAVTALQKLGWQFVIARMNGATLGSSLASMVNPVFLVTAAVVGLAFGYEHLVSWQSRAAEEHLKEIERLGALQPQYQRLTDRLAQLEAIQKSGKSSVDAKKAAEEEEKTIIDQLVAIYPDFMKFLYDEHGQRRSISEAIKLENEHLLTNARRTLADAEARLLDAKAMATQRINHALLLEDLARATPFFAAAQANTARVMSDVSKTIDTDMAALNKARASLAELLKSTTDRKTKPPGLDHPTKADKTDPYLAYEAQMKAEAQVRQERLALWDKHQADLNAIFGDGLDKQVLEINTRYDAMLNRERSFGADEAILKAIELKRDQDIEQAKTDFQAKQAAERKKIAEEEAKEKRRILEESGTAEQGFFDGIGQFIQRQGTVFQQWSQAAHQMMQGIESAFSQGFKGILTGQMTFSQGLRSIWQGVTGAIIQMLAQMAAKWIVGAIAAQLFGAASSDAAKTQAVAQQEAAASTLWATYSGIPFVGPVLAAGFIALMNATLVANAAGAKGIVGAAEGGWFDRPTMTVIGEGRRPELVVPDTSFKDFAANLSSNILAQERQAQDYGRQAVGYARAGTALGGGGSAMQEVHLTLSNVNILDSSQRGLQQLGNHVITALQTVGGQRGQVLVPGRVVTGGI